jgi:hypothetical protein
MNARLNRREATKLMLYAAIGGSTAVRLNASTAIFHGSAYAANFESVGSRIHQAIARGEATGVAVALVHGGTHRLGGGFWLGESRNEFEGYATHSVQHGLNHQAIYHDHSHDLGR